MILVLVLEWAWHGSSFRLVQEITNGSPGAELDKPKHIPIYFCDPLGPFWHHTKAFGSRTIHNNTFPKVGDVFLSICWLQRRPRAPIVVCLLGDTWRPQRLRYGGFGVPQIPSPRRGLLKAPMWPQSGPISKETPLTRRPPLREALFSPRGWMWGGVLARDSDHKPPPYSHGAC